MQHLVGLVNNKSSSFQNWNVLRKFHEQFTNTLQLSKLVNGFTLKENGDIHLLIQKILSLLVWL